MTDESKDILTIIHNAGFFSCSSIALQDIMIYYQNHGRLPDVVDRTVQYGFYKAEPLQNLIPFYFQEHDLGEPALHPKIAMISKIQGVDPQYSDYRELYHEALNPFIERFFIPSDYIAETIKHLQINYQIDLQNTCAVFYRGNDKSRETAIAPYQDFIDKAKEIQAQNPGIKFLVQPDETEFLEAFLKEFPDAIYFSETPHMSKKDSAIFFELPIAERPEHGKFFLSAVLIMSQCKHLITHSGNGGLWSVIYRGNGENVYQWLNNKFI